MKKNNKIQNLYGENSELHIDNQKIKPLIHDIRNMKVMTKIQINSLNQLNTNELIQLIYSYNNMMDYINTEILDNL